MSQCTSRIIATKDYIHRNIPFGDIVFSLKNLKEFEHNKKIIAERAAKIKESFKSVAEKLSSVTLTIKAKTGEDDKLFGSVTNMNVAEALALEGFDIDKKKIVMEPIKKLGEYSAAIKLHTDLSAEVKINVVQE